MGLPVLASDIGPISEIGKYLSTVKSESLSNSDEIWARRAAELLNANRNWYVQEGATAEFGHSPFHLDVVLRKTASLYEAHAARAVYS